MEKENSNPQPERVRLGREVASAREALGLTQTQLSEVSGVDRGVISLIERGRRNVSVDLVNKVVRPLSLSLTLGEKK